MNAGNLRDRITIERPVKTTDPQWGEKTSFVPLATVWAEVTPTRASESADGRGVQADTTYAVSIRYTASITTEHRIVFRGKVLDIVSAIDVDNRRRELAIVAKENTTNA